MLARTWPCLRQLSVHPAARAAWIGALAILILAAIAPAFDTPRASEAGGSTVIAVDADPATPGVQTSAPYRADSPEIAVDIIVQDADHIGAFEFELFFDRQSLEFLRGERGLFLGSSGRTAICDQTANTSTVRFGCGTFGPPPPDGPSGGGVLARLFFRPRMPGATCLLLLTVETASVFGDALPTAAQNGCLDLAADNDGDGCTDRQELGDDPRLGGRRDPASAWDFFDVPFPALSPSNAGGTRDRGISLFDVYAVVAYIGARDGAGPTQGGVSYNSDINENGVPDGREYDRAVSADPAAPWRSGPPTGGVSLQDVMVALAQVGHSCQGAP